MQNIKIQGLKFTIEAESVEFQPSDITEEFAIKTLQDRLGEISARCITIEETLNEKLS